MQMKNVLTIVLLVIAIRGNCNNSVRQKVDSLYMLAWDYRIKNPDSALYFGNIQKKLALNSNYDLGFVNACYVIGYAYDEKFYFDVAASHYFEGLDVVNRNSGRDFDRKKLFLLQCLGVVYEKTFQYDDALKYMFDALKVAQETNNDTAIGELYYNIAINYKRKDEKSLAIEFFNKSIKVNESNDNFFFLARAYNAMGGLYDNNGEFELGRDCFLKALKISKNDSIHSHDRAMFLSNLGENYFLQNQFDQAKIYYLQALEVGLNNNDTSRIKWIYNNLGDVYFKEGDFKHSINYFEKAIALGNPEVLDEELQRAYKNIAQAYEALGEYKLASDFKSGYIAQTDKIIAIKEDLTEQNAQYRMKELDWQREIMQKEVLLASSEKENFWGRIIIGVALLLILYSSRLIYVYYRKISKARKVVNSYNVSMFDF